MFAMWIDITRNGQTETVTIRVTKFTNGRPMIITGWGYGDAEPPEPDEIEFEIIDEEGFEVMSDQLTEDDFARAESAALAIVERGIEE